MYGKPPPPPSDGELRIGMMLGECHKLFHDRVRRECERAGMPGGFRQVLFHLSHEDGLPQHELAERMHLRPPTVSVTLQKMEAQGLIARRPDPADQRRMRVFLLEEGRILDGRVRTLFDKTERGLHEALEPEERAELARLLSKVSKSLKGCDL